MARPAPDADGGPSDGVPAGALGLLETLGLVAAVEAADAMLKAADVRLVRQERVVPGLVTHVVVGETAAVRSAVDAGAAAAARVGRVAASHVIPSPAADVWRRLLPAAPPRARAGRGGPCRRGRGRRLPRPDRPRAPGARPRPRRPGPPGPRDRPGHQGRARRVPPGPPREPVSVQGPGPGRVPAPPSRRAAVARRWDRLGVRSRLRTLLPSASPDPPDDEAGRRGLAMGLSVVVAAVLWFSFNMREVYTVAVEMPVEVVALPADRALRERPPATATATLQGDGWTLLALTRRRPTIQVAATGETVDLAQAAAREQALADVAVRNVQPGAIELALDARTTRRLPIRLRESVRTRPPFGLLRPPTLRPDSVTVFGAQSILGRLTDWPTEPFVVRDLNDDVTRTVALSDTLAGLVIPSVRSTTVSVAVGQFTRAVRDLDVEVVGLPAGVDGVRFDPARVTVEYDVPSEGAAFDEAERSAAFRAVVDWADIARDTTSGSVPVSVRLPGGLGVRDATPRPSRVEYFLVRRPAPAGL